MKIKKIIALSISVLLTLSLIGCSSPKDIFSFVLSGKNNKTSDGLEISETLNKDAVFKEIDEISLTDSNYVSSLIYSNGKFYATTYSYEYTDESEEDESESKTIININVTSFTSSSDLNTVTIKSEVQNKYYSDDFMGVDNSGNLYFVSNVTSDEDDSNTFYFEKFDSQGNLIETSEIPMNGSDDWVGKVCLDHEGNLFVTKAHSIDIFSSDFSAIGQYKMPDENVSITDMVVGNSGKLILVTSKWENDAPVYSAYNIDKSGTATPLSCSDLLGNRTLFNSVGYEYIYRINSSVYAFDDGDTSAKEIVNFYDSDVNPNGIGEIVFSDKETFITYNSDEGIITKYKKVPREEVKDKKVITLGCVDTPYSISKEIIEYNKKSDSYRIKIIEYSAYNNSADVYAGTKRFNIDLTSGNSPDIIIADNTNVNNLIDKGVFADLTPLMNEKNDIKKEDLVYSAQNTFAKGDKLYCIFPSYSVNCAVIKKKNYKEDMTIDDILEWENKTGNKALRAYMTRETVLMSMLNNCTDAFIDPETGKCSFDSDEFVKLLDYAATYPVETPEEYYTDSDTHEQDFRNDKALFDFQYLDNFRSFNYEMQATYGEETVLADIPVKGAKGYSISPQFIIGISAKSKNKDEAWDFIDSLIQPEKYNGDSTSYYGFPVLQSAFDKMKSEATEKYFYYDENNEKQYYDEYYYIGEDSYEVLPLTKEKADELADYVVHADQIMVWDEDLNNIINEETQPLFIGQKTSKEVAAIIQSRVQIYINEKK